MSTPRGILITTLLVVGLGLTGCGSDDSPAPASGGSDTAGTPAVIDVTITGDSVTPNGERVEVPKGQDVTLKVTADEAGEIHVHSSPEQELEYDAGTTTLTITDLDQPGIIDVESHSLEKVIVQLEVS
ncbi:hypothetical protein [Nocardioides sp.]|uniref:hypothetical protein n=1 Tax=Nocardioides sp. TaxID=35761 RepID=UPI003D0AB601